MKKIVKLTVQSLLFCGAAGFVSCTETNINQGEEGTTLVAPTDLDVTNLTFDGATLVWSAVDGAEIYEVECSAWANTTLETSETTHILTGLTSETEYTWRVRAVNGEIESEWATGEPFTTSSQPVGTLAAPTGLDVANLTFDGATLAWNAVDGATGYQVIVGTSAETPEFTATSYTAKGLDPETEYIWKVRAVKGAIQSEWVTGEPFTTLKAPLAPPTGLEIEGPTMKGVILVWDVVEIDAYIMKMQGVSFNIREDFLTDLEDGRQEFTIDITYEDFAEFYQQYGQYAINLEELLVPATEYTWQVCGVKGTGDDAEQSVYTEGPGFTTLSPPAYTDFAGNYNAHVEQSLYASPEMETWTGAIAASGYDEANMYGYYTLSTMYGIAPVYMDYLEGSVYADNYTSIGTDNSGNSVYQSVGALNAEGTAILGWLPGSEFGYELTWAPATRTLSYPTVVNVTGYGPLTAVWALMGKNAQGQVASRISNVYVGLKLTVDAGGGTRVLSGTRINISDEKLVNAKTFTADRIVSTRLRQAGTVNANVAKYVIPAPARQKYNKSK